MATYTHRLETIDGNIVVWIDRDGHQMIMQPHHPSAVNLAPWASEAEANTWAAEEKAHLEAADAAQEQAVSDSQRLVEIHAMLTALSNK
jgi:endoglucanase Acf2